MKIKISSLKDGIHEMDFTGSTEEIGLQDTYQGNYELHVVIDKSPHQMVLTADLNAEAALTCDRCCEPYRFHPKVEFEMVYLQNYEDVNSESEDIQYLSPEADKIDISQELIDYALLAIPLKKLCSEECKGLCPRCGTNLNTGTCACSSEHDDDPRWSALQQLKNKVSDNP